MQSSAGSKMGRKRLNGPKNPDAASRPNRSPCFACKGPGVRVHPSPLSKTPDSVRNYGVFVLRQDKAGRAYGSWSCVPPLAFSSVILFNRAARVSAYRHLRYRLPSASFPRSSEYIHDPSGSLNDAALAPCTPFLKS
jgi:hypothetical protein